MLTVEEMNACDEGLKRTIQNLWPVQTKKTLNLYVPPKEGNKLYFIIFPVQFAASS